MLRESFRAPPPRKVCAAPGAVTLRVGTSITGLKVSTGEGGAEGGRLRAGRRGGPGKSWEDPKHKKYLRRSATEARFGLEFESVSKIALGFEFTVVSLSSDDAT